MTSGNPDIAKSSDDRSQAIRLLLAEAPVGVTDAACLTYRFHAATCSVCIDACPTAALEQRSGRIEMRGDCLGCGRCHAACPTGAIRVAGFNLGRRDLRDAEQDGAGANPGALRITCWKSPRSVDAAGKEAQLRVPCLFGLSEVQMVQLCARTLPRAIVWVDHGWCSDCSAGRGQRLDSRLQEITTNLRATGLSDELQPQIDTQPLPVAAMPRRIPDALGRRRLGRRAFFSGLAREALMPAVVSALSHDEAVNTPIRTTTQASNPRFRLLDGLNHISTQFGGHGLAGLPVGLFHRVSLRSDCCNHGVCATHCPSGALRRIQNTKTESIRLCFDSRACIGCGHCVRSCPESALAIEFGTGYQKVTELARFAERRCSACDRALSARGEEVESGLCGNCFKAHRLARSAFSQLFGPRT